MGEENENWRRELEDINGLSLIDISVEDDNLLFSSSLDPTTFEFSGNFNFHLQFLEIVNSHCDLVVWFMITFFS